jgi:site-specific DNA recombinase
MRMGAIYARVSSEQQREENTIASQTASLIEFAKNHELEGLESTIALSQQNCN